MNSRRLEAEDSSSDSASSLPVSEGRAPLPRPPPRCCCCCSATNDNETAAAFTILDDDDEGSNTFPVPTSAATSSALRTCSRFVVIFVCSILDRSPSWTLEEVTTKHLRQLIRSSTATAGIITATTTSISISIISRSSRSRSRTK